MNSVEPCQGVVIGLGVSGAKCYYNTLCLKVIYILLSPFRDEYMLCCCCFYFMKSSSGVPLVLVFQI